MPNWVYNGLTIEGNPDEVKKLMTQMNKPFAVLHDSWNMETGQMEVKQSTYPNPVFAFWNIHSPLDDGIDMLDYVKQPARLGIPTDSPDWFAKELEFGRTQHDWYNWNITNWGTKWDVAVEAGNEHPDTYMEDSVNGENHVVFYNFNTAWSRPMPALCKLSEQYPSLLFTLSYEEETGWGGELEILRGEVISESEYDNMCRDCDSTDTMEYCENECGEICSSCNYMGEADLDAVKECQTHKIYLDNVPEYRKAEIK